MRSILRALSFVCASSALALLVACGGGGAKSNGASPESVSTKAGASGESLAQAYLAALASLRTSTSMAALSDGLAPLRALLGGSAGGAPIDLEGLALPEIPAAEFSKFLSDRLFTNGNVESSDATSVTYLLAGDDICPYHLSDGTTTLLPAPGGSMLEACTSVVTQVQLRVRATEPTSNEVDFTFLLGPDKTPALLVKLTPTTADFELDLAGVKPLLRALAGGSSAPDVNVFGVVDLEIAIERQVGERLDVTLSAAVKQPVEISVAAEGTSVTLKTEPKDPLASLRVDGVDDEVVVALDLGRTSLKVLGVDATNTVQEVEIALAGLSLGATLAEGLTGDFKIAGLGLGDAQSRVTINGATLASLDLSPRRVDTTFRPDPAAPGRTIFGVGAKTELELFLDARVTGGTDPRFSGKTYVFTLDAGSGAPQFEPYVLDDGFAHLKMVNGTLTLTDLGDGSLTVPSGSCLRSKHDPTAQSLAQYFTAGACL